MMMLPSLPLGVSLTALASALNVVSAFDVRQLPGSPSSLNYRNDDADIANEVATRALPFFLRDPQEEAIRRDLKKKLAFYSIESYDATRNANDGETGLAEIIMKQLEQVNKWPRPAHHPELNARWSFVFTGVPTIGMRLITLLSRLSVGIKVLDFQDVFLEVQNNSTRVVATVSASILQQPMELQVCTRLEPDTDDSKGTFLMESFEKLLLNGVEIPTPESWKSSRSLEITYLDEDMMIARTAGEEPHLLLRHSSCSTDDVECDIDAEQTQTRYLQQARTKYGPTLTRSLVDRDFCDNGDAEFDGGSVIRLIQTILNGKEKDH